MIKDVCFIFIIFFCSCEVNNKLDYALNFAGNNRHELEKVLEYYKYEREKLAAAKFLIENMPNWYSYNYPERDSLESVLTCWAENRIISDTSKKLFAEMRFESYSKLYDSKIISAAYLIENIDYSFDVWKKCLWNRTLGFEDFCELILPYRVSNEPLSRWRKLYYDKYFSYLDSLYTGHDPVEACRIVSEKLKQTNYTHKIPFDIPRLSATFLYNNIIGSCRETSDATLYAMRACGIPAATDMYIYSPEYQHGHMWNVVRDTSGHYVPFFYRQFSQNNEDGEIKRKKGKVYRYCFGMQKERYTWIPQEEVISPVLKNCLIKDVTAGYFGENQLNIPMTDRESKCIYLAVFSPRGWIPIDIGHETNENIIFNNVEPHVIYQLVSLNEFGRYDPIGYPFIFNTKDVNLLKPDTNHLVHASLKRKMALTQVFKDFLTQNVVGAKIEGANDLSFTDSKLLYRFTDTLISNYNLLTPVNEFTCRYLRYTPPPGKKMELAEIGFFENVDCIQTLSVNILTDVATKKYLNKVIDKDVLSFYFTKDTNMVILFDMMKPVKIKKILFAPRNDDNFVWPENEYELFYQSGINGWQSLGKKKAVAHDIEYDVPDHALLWLRNLSKGSEEQVFIYTADRQQFTFDLQE